MTGACGFVGRHLVRSLIEDTAELWLVDDLSTGRHPDEWLPDLLGGVVGSGHRPRIYEFGAGRVLFLEGDVVSLFAEHTSQSVSWPSFEEAYHLASIVGGRKKIEGEPLQVGLDLAIDSIFLRWAWRSHCVGRLLYASSSAAYPVELQGEQDAIALEESHIDFAHNSIAMPDMTYGWSKLTGEYLTWLLANRHDVPACSVRPFSGYGEDQDLSYPIPAIADRAARREDPLVVWGSGRQGRDFVHIADCIVAMRLAIAGIEDGSGVNIGSGKLTTFLDVARTFARLAGYGPEVRGTESGPVGVHSRYAAVGESERRLGWSPSIALEEGLARVLAAREEQLAAAAHTS